MIKFGMKVPEIFAQLVKGYKKVTGRNPEGLDLIRIRQESLRRFQDMNKVVDMQTGKSIDPSKPIMGGTQEIKEVQKRIDSGVAATVEKMLAMEPIDAMKEANLVIGRKGPYKNLTQKDAKKILEDTEDHIFERNIKPKETDMDFDDNDFAEGGRIGFKKGMDRRTFMKIMGGLTTLPIVGKFFKGAEVAAPVVEKATEVASGAPPYFFNLVERIRALGKKFDGPKERSETYKYKDYEMQVDNDTGQIEITKQKLGYDERVGEGVVSEEYMSFKPGRADETTGGRKVADEYEENTGFTDKDGKLKDVESGVSEETVMDGSISKEELEQEIIEQLSKETSSIKKASGGIARMLGE
jgi:hypothetical protein